MLLRFYSLNTCTEFYLKTSFLLRNHIYILSFFEISTYRIVWKKLHVIIMILALSYSKIIIYTTIAPHVLRRHYKFILKLKLTSKTKINLVVHCGELIK